MPPFTAPISTATYALLADGVLVVHVAIAAFVVGGLPAVLVGHGSGWRWVDDRRFRFAHLAAIGVVAAESWFGAICPLTTVERWLRTQAGEATYGGDFVAHWLGRLLYYDAPPSVFTAAYTGFAIAIIATWWRFPPRRSRASSPNDAPSKR